MDWEEEKNGIDLSESSNEENGAVPNGFRKLDM